MRITVLATPQISGYMHHTGSRPKRINQTKACYGKGIHVGHVAKVFLRGTPKITTEPGTGGRHGNRTRLGRRDMGSTVTRYSCSSDPDDHTTCQTCKIDTFKPLHIPVQLLSSKRLSPMNHAGVLKPATELKQRTLTVLEQERQTFHSSGQALINRFSNGLCPYCLRVQRRGLTWRSNPYWSTFFTEPVYIERNLSKWKTSHCHRYHTISHGK